MIRPRTTVTTTAPNSKVMGGVRKGDRCLRPIRARGGGTAYLPWWGIRHDVKDKTQGYSR